MLPSGRFPTPSQRTASDTPDFGIAHWPAEEYGQFYKGDSYLLLNTYKQKGGDKLLWDVHTGRFASRERAEP